jgi:hypothetical protein
MILDSIVPVAMLLALIIFFIKSNYLRYGDVKFLLTGFALLTAFLMLTGASITGLLSSLVSLHYLNFLSHGLGSLAAWFFALDAYRASRVLLK